MTITDVSDAHAEAVARSIYEALLPHRPFDGARPEVQAKYLEAARAAVVTMRLYGMIERVTTRPPTS